MIISNFIITFFLTEAIAANEEAVRNMIDKIPLYMIFSVSIYAPFVEEIIFRQNELWDEVGKDKNKVKKLVIK